MTNFEKVHFYFRDYESPEHFIDWGFLFAIGSCLGRKVWFQGGEPFFPNEQIIIVGPPGVGKSLPSRKLMDLVKSLYKEIAGTKILEPLVKVAPTCVTLEKLYEHLEKCGTAISKDITGSKPYFHSSLSFMLSDEMGLLFKPGPAAQNLTLFLNAGYDCTSKFEYETKRSGENRITNLCVNFFGCATPEWIESNIDSNVIGNGWSSRVLWIYGEEKRKLTTFYKFTSEQDSYLEEIKKHFRAVAELYGEVFMTPECLDFYDKWYQQDPAKLRINHDTKLDSYYSRKRAHTIKVAMLCHFAEKTTMLIELEDFKKALKILATAEMSMHQALASVNVNPTSKLAVDILRYIKQQELSNQQGPTTAEIIGEMFNKAQRGLESIEEARSYLNMTEQIKSEGGRWMVNKKIVAADFKKLSPVRTGEKIISDDGVVGIMVKEGTALYGK
jgi:hypothetical protein